MFGSSGYIKQPSSVIDNFLYRWENYHLSHGKSILRVSRIIDLDVHISRIDQGRYLVPEGSHPLEGSNEFYNKFSENTHIHPESYPLACNHYAIQSYEFFMKVKVTRGDAYAPQNDYIRNEKYFKNYDRNEVYDDELKKISLSYNKI